MASRKELLARYGDASAKKADSDKDKKKKKKKSKKSNVLLIDNDDLVAKSKRRKMEDGDEDDEEQNEASAVVVTDFAVGKSVEDVEKALLEERLAKKRAESVLVWKTEENSLNNRESLIQQRNDASPPRKRHDSPEASVARRRHDSPDASPPRKRHDSPDASPPRKRHDSPDASPPRRRHDSPDASPPRKRHDSPDASRPRRRHDSPDASPPRRRKDSPDFKKPVVPKDEQPAIVEAVTDRRGRKLEMLSEMQGGAKSVESQYEWGGGIKEEKKKNEPPPSTFTVSIDDEERDAKLKDAMRWGDPMAAFVSRKSESSHKSSKKSKKEAPSGPQLEYTGRVQYPNRFNIKPGVAWDGRDRSNGFEAKYFAHKNAAKVNADSHFAWSVNDL